MDGTELGRQIARMRAESSARTKLTILWRGLPEMTASTAAGALNRMLDLGRPEYVRVA